MRIVPSLLLGLLVLGPTEIRAAEEPPVVKAMLDAAALATTARPTYKSLDMAPDGTIRLKGLSMVVSTAPTAPETQVVSYDIEELSLKGVREPAPGRFEVEEAVWSGTTIKMADFAAAAIPLTTGKTVYFKQPSAAPTELEKMRAASMLAKDFTVPEVLVLARGQSFTIERLHWTWDGDPETGAGLSQFEMGRLSIPSAMFKSEQGDNPLAQAGYDGLEFTGAGKGIVTFVAEAMGFDVEFRLTGKDVGSLVMSMAADGIPAALFVALRAGEPNLDEMGRLAQGLALRRFKVRFEDQSLTQRIIAFAARSSGTDERALVAQAIAGLQSSLAALNNPALTSRAVAAVTAFLNAPRSITLSLSPAQPITGAQFMQSAQDPATLLNMLAVGISAND